MLFHVTLSYFRNHTQSPIFKFRRVLACCGQPVDVVIGRRRLHSSKGVALGQSHSAVTHKDESGDIHLHEQCFQLRETVDGQTFSPFSSGSEGTLTPPKNPTDGKTLTFGRRHHTGVPISSTPSSKWELLQHIRRLLFVTPPAPFLRLLSIHRRYRPFQSVESYNLLLIFSIRHSFSGLTRLLLDSMAANRIEPDEDTEKLVVRYLVSSAQWATAWQQVMARYSSIARIPMPVLLELLAPGTRNIYRPKRIRTKPLSSRGQRLYSYGQKVPASSAEDSPSIPPDTLVLLLHRFPTLSLQELAKLPPRVVSYVVRGLLRNGHETSAILLTKNHLMSLPSTLTSTQVEFARDLIHLHLTMGEVKLANYKKRRRLVETLLSLQPSLYPNAKTVFLLMRYMAKSHRCGIEAYLFFKHCRGRWGPTIDSMDNRRRVIQYALKQRKYGIAKEIYQLPPLPMEQPQTKNHRPFRVRSWRTIYPRSGKGKRYWKRVFIRYLGQRRVWSRRISSIRWPKQLTKD